MLWAIVTIPIAGMKLRDSARRFDSVYDLESFDNDDENVYSKPLSSSLVETEEPYFCRRSSLSPEDYIGPYGDTVANNIPMCEDLQWTDLMIWDDKECTDLYEFDYEETGAAFCAGSPGKNRCQGSDSGGPAVIDLLEECPIQVGIVEWGNSCASEGWPGVFNKVHSFIDWVNLTICDPDNADGHIHPMCTDPEYDCCASMSGSLSEIQKGENGDEVVSASLVEQGSLAEQEVEQELEQLGGSLAEQSSLYDAAIAAAAATPTPTSAPTPAPTGYVYKRGKGQQSDLGPTWLRGKEGEIQRVGPAGLHPLQQKAFQTLKRAGPDEWQHSMREIQKGRHLRTAPTVDKGLQLRQQINRVMELRRQAKIGPSLDAQLSEAETKCREMNMADYIQNNSAYQKCVEINEKLLDGHDLTVDYVNTLPWMARVHAGLYSDCGGTVIECGWVLTSKHCLVEDGAMVDATNITIYLPEVSPNSAWGARAEKTVTKVHALDASDGVAHDFVLIQFVDDSNACATSGYKVCLPYHVQPGCEGNNCDNCNPSYAGCAKQPYTAGQTVHVLGWGDGEYPIVEDDSAND